MKTDVEELTPTRVKLTVEVPFDELKPNLDKAYKEISQQVAIKGFRRGKVPAPLIDKYVGRGAVLQEAVNDALPGLYGKAVEESELFVLGQPEVEVTELDDGNQFAFTAEVDIRPKFEVPDYDGLEVVVDDAEVTDEQVDETIDNLRERFASLTTADRPIEEGDFATIDLVAKIDGEEVADASTTGYSYEVGSKSAVEGLDDALVGLSAGEEKTFTGALAGGEHAGEEAEITATVQSVKVKNLPELDEEFAQLASEFDTVEELREDVRKRLERQVRMQQLSEARDKALEALLEKVDIPLPDAVVDEEIGRRNQQLEQQLQMAGMSKEDYLADQEKSEEEFETEVADAARLAVKGGFVLDQLAVQEELNVENEELSEYVVTQAMQMGVQPQQLAQYLTENNQLPAIVSEVLRSKALNLVVEHVSVKDESGNVIDVEAVQRELNGETGETVEADEDADDTAGADETAEGSEAAAETAEAAEDKPADAEASEGAAEGKKDA
ncbi:trigger factor [Actinomadura sp. WAC 06369]|uniref:trigger factor n=1 Tax=Actinomadura sp. WAC 06369 TaxID=2203193 RepID=UPI000F76C2EE|nr:trigger factor [Actinomadura sp. WAC 06369]RSN66819.1 trigger factor [Actinomadura sp. WAC 06369]